jgi:hypothetical protein
LNIAPRLVLHSPAAAAAAAATSTTTSTTTITITTAILSTSPRLLPPFIRLAFEISGAIAHEIIYEFPSGLSAL